MLSVATSVRRQGHEVHYLVYPDSQDRDRLASLLTEADVLAITALTPTVHMAAHIAATAKSLRPEIVTVVGGPHISGAPDETMDRYRGFDVAIPGPGEEVLPALIAELPSLGVVGGAYYRGAAGAPTLLPSTSTTRRDVSLSPDYSLLSRPLKEYAHNVRTQDGCPYGCTFCVEKHSWSGKAGSRALDAVLDEIDLLASSTEPATLVHFSDPVFTLDKYRTIELCTRLRQYADRLRFSIDTRADLLDRELVLAASQAGVSYYRLGLEDSQDEILAAVNKGTTASKGLAAARLVREVQSDAVIHAYWLTGLPGSSRESIFENAKAIRYLIANELVDIVGNRIFVPYPETMYYQDPSKYGLVLLTRDWSRYDRLSFPVYRLNRLSEFEIYDGFLFLEAVQLGAYQERLGEHMEIPLETLDYVYASYVAASDNPAR
jgi:radical SAM superfamily enzyme YgiQ (UPF0313 family)